MRVTAPDCLELGIVDAVIPEPPGGAHSDPDAACRAVGDVIAEALDALRKLRPEELLERRYRRFRSLGRFRER